MTVDPGEFDARWYAGRYPDVALSGLDPVAHYLRIGRMLGRAGHPGQDRAPGDASSDAFGGTAYEARPEDELADVAARFGTRGRRDDPPELEAAPDDPLIPRPRGLRLGAAAAQPVGPVQIEDPLDAFLLAVPGDLARVAGPLHVLRALRDRRHLGLAELAPLTAGAALRDGPDALTDIWLEGSGRMRLKLGTETAERPAGGLVSAWQVMPGTDGRLRRVGHAALPLSGPLWFDLSVDNPFMPILVVLADAAGFARGGAVIPFPSLARGGPHGAELALHQDYGAGMAGFWQVTEGMLRALELQQPAIGRIEVLPVTATGPANGSEPIFDPRMSDWLEEMFALRPGVVAAEPDPDAPTRDRGQIWLAEAHPPRDRPGARHLQLPADQIPTLAALLASEDDLPGVDCLSGPFLVADSQTGRPRWSVTLPVQGLPWLADLQPLPRAAACPTLRGGTAPDRDGGHPADALAPMALGIARRAREPLSQAQSLMRQASDAPGRALPHAPVGQDPFSIVLRLRDADRALTLVHAILEAAGLARLEVLVLPEDAVQGARFFTHASTETRIAARVLPLGADLAKAAARAEHELILTLDDHVLPDCARALEALRAMLACDDRIGSAACTVLRETMAGKNSVLAASGGLFPASISLLAAPALVLDEPDLGQVLPMATYPVIGTALDFALLRRAAVLAAAGPIGVAGPDRAETAFALAAGGAGYVHLVTSAVAVGTTAPPRARRSEMDPVGFGASRLRAWDRLLASVTLLRELR